MVIPQARLTFYRWVKGVGRLLESPSHGPERLVRAVLFRWQEKRFPWLAGQAPYGTKQLLSDESVESFATWLASLPSFNDAAYWLASAYAIWVGDEQRTERSLYFTPPKLADRVIANLVDRGASLTEHRWFDPACGGAAFLVPVAQHMARAMAKQGLSAKETLKAIERNLAGIDLDPTLIHLSEQFLLMALGELVQAAGKHPKFSITKTDGLTAYAPTLGRIDVVVCNPPYRKLSSTEADRYRPGFSSVMDGQPNIYALFMQRTTKLVEAGGLIGLLTPTSFLSGQNFKSLRTELLETTEVLQIDMMPSRKATFIQVLQETTITVLRRGKTGHVSSTSVYVGAPDGAFSRAGSIRLPTCGRPWPIPKAAEDTTLLSYAARSTARLSDYGYTAKIGMLVAYRDQRRRHATKPAPSSKRTVLPLVWATDISPAGGFEHGREQRLARPDLFVEVGSLQTAGVIKKPAVLLQRVTSSEQPRRLVATPAPATLVSEHGGYVCENHVVVLEKSSDASCPPALMARVLGSEAVDRVFRSISGTNNIAVYELNELPLPSLEALNKLVTSNDFDVAVHRAYERSALS